LPGAYALTLADDVVGLPDWAENEMYDVSATSSLARATTEDRLAMWRAMLADRFGLVAHLEKRTRPARRSTESTSSNRRRSGRISIGWRFPLEASTNRGIR
jgi:hypothetical protein